MGIASLTLGITGIIAWLDPFLGSLINIAGIVTGIISLARKEVHSKRAIAGIVLGIIGLVLSAIVFFAGVMFLMDMYYQSGYGHMTW